MLSTSSTPINNVCMRLSFFFNSTFSFLTCQEVSEKEQDECKSRDDGPVEPEDLYGGVSNQSVSPR
jgi:hypothetical protein